MSMGIIFAISVIFGRFLLSNSDVDAIHTKAVRGIHSGLIDLPYNVNVTCDGPTTVGGTTSFFASLYSENYHNSGLIDEELICVWSDRFYFRWSEVRKKTSSLNCTFERTYASVYDVGKHTVIVEVATILNWEIIARGSVSFSVTDYINVDIIMIQNSTSCSQLCSVATNNTIQFTSSIHDPSGFFQGSMFLLDWDFGDGHKNFKQTSMSVQHVYHLIASYEVSVTMTAILKSGATRNGMATITIKALDAIQNLTASGVDDVIIGKEQQINISCFGSPPVSFCWSIFRDNSTSGASPLAESCMHGYLQEDCRMQIDYQFNESCQYFLNVTASNEVSVEALTAWVRPEAPPDVPKPGGIAGVVVGILLGLTLTCICIAIMVQQVRKSRLRNVEVADFNFHLYPVNDSVHEHARRLNEAANKLPDEKTPLLVKKPSLDVRWVKGSETVQL